jgi:hypothetical protein
MSTGTVKIAVTLTIDEDPIWHMAIETNPKAAQRLTSQEYIAVVRAAEAELRNQIRNKTQNQKQDNDPRTNPNN